ncbi:MAG: beta-ketoacyl-[acyl-carrier-protein] synthase family protein [Chthoniobacterales bacterium]|nr:beta-ketoacyl-[acyl-carrier-protein] synthase family protein [Chthoniobacterales bacterium]
MLPQNPPLVTRYSLPVTGAKPQFAITGMGAVSAGGKNVEELWQSVLQGRVKAERYQFKKSGVVLPIYRAELPELSKKDQHLVRQADRTAQLLLAAAREAWNNAQLTNSTYAKDRIGIIIGSSRGPMMLQEEQISSLKKKPSAAVYSTSSSMAGLLAAAFSIEGPSFVVASTCTSGATALAMGQQLLQSGVLDLVLVGGVDAPLTESLLEQYRAAGVLAEQQDPSMALRPFDRKRSGTVLGEGAVVVMLESEKLALKRTAPIIGKLHAVALQSHPGRRASLDPQGKALQQVIKGSLEQALLTLDRIGVVHLHGTGTKQNDLIESCAVSSIFGNLVQQPISWANKSITGHILGASPLFQLVLALQTMRHRWVPSLVHCDQLDPACPIRVSRGELIAASPALCLNSGFWGNVSSIVISP